MKNEIKEIKVKYIGGTSGIAYEMTEVEGFGSALKGGEEIVELSVGCGSKATEKAILFDDLNGKWIPKSLIKKVIRRSDKKENGCWNAHSVSVPAWWARQNNLV